MYCFEDQRNAFSKKDISPGMDSLINPFDQISIVLQTLLVSVQTSPSQGQSMEMLHKNLNDF